MSVLTSESGGVETGHPMGRRHISVMTQAWPIAGHFTIARGSRTQAIVVTASISADGYTGRGECTPYARYGETPESVTAQIEAMSDFIASGGNRDELIEAMPAGAARNALDCALWDLEAKTSGVPAHVLAGLDRLSPVTTAFTISLGSPEQMAKDTQAASARPILKIKLGGGADDPARISAVRQAAPDAILIVDANEGWTPETLQRNLDACLAADVACIEQPLPATDDAALRACDHAIPLCADESAHGIETLDRVAAHYDMINIKLDKTGGLTAALKLIEAAKARDLGVMVGCMLGSSLAMAPAFLLTPSARFVDLDAPLLLAKDCEPGMTYQGSLIYPPIARLWG